VERHADRAFAIVGVNTDGERDFYRRQNEDFGVTWRSAWQGSTHGPIPRQWGVRAYPTSYLLDAQHRVRYVNVSGRALEGAIEQLLRELEDAGSAVPAEAR
jgi:hypothetical protein